MFGNLETKGDNKMMRRMAAYIQRITNREMANLAKELITRTKDKLNTGICVNSDAFKGILGEAVVTSCNEN
jgi:DNA-binding transcriptional regulator WhiA